MLVNRVLIEVSCLYRNNFYDKDDEHDEEEEDEENSRGGIRMSRTHNLHRVPHVRLEEVRLTTNCVIPPSIPLTFLCFNIGCSVCVFFSYFCLCLCMTVCLCNCFLYCVIPSR